MPSSTTTMNYGPSIMQFALLRKLKQIWPQGLLLKEFERKEHEVDGLAALGMIMATHTDDGKETWFLTARGRTYLQRQGLHV